MLHLSLRITQPHERFLIIRLIGSQLRQPQIAVEGTLVMVAPATVQTGLEKIRRQDILALTQRKTPATQRNPSQQWGQAVRLPDE